MLDTTTCVAGMERESVQTGSDGMGYEKESKDQDGVRKNSNDFPGSWSDVSRGALFEMEVERALPKGETRLGGHARNNISDQLGEGNSQIYSNLEVEMSMGNIQSNHELDDEYGFYGHAHNFSQMANAADNDEPNLDGYRYFTQRRTSTRSIPIPNRKSHMTYRRHPTV